MTEQAGKELAAAAPQAWQPLSRRVSLLICLLLVTAVFLVYWPALRYPFVNFDDLGYLIQNSRIKAGLSWDTIPWAFTSYYAGNWHPLTWISHALDCQIFGLVAGGHHLTNLLLHAGNTVLVFLLLRRLTGAGWPCAFIAALFGLHPLHVESVAWIAERKDVLSTFFFLLTLSAYATYAAKLQAAAQNKAQMENDETQTDAEPRNASGPSASAAAAASDFAIRDSFVIRHSSFVITPWIFYLLSLLLFALGLMSKPMLVTLPFVLLLLDFWPLGRVSRFGFRVSRRDTTNSDANRADSKLESRNSKLKFLLIEKIPFFGLSTPACVLTFLAQSSTGAVASTSAAPVWQRFPNALISYMLYLQKLFWPTNLSVYYPYRESINWPGAGGALALLLSISVLSLIWLRQRPYMAVGWFWFLGTLVPVIGLVQVGLQAMADRYSYIPSIGLFVALTFLLTDLLTGRVAREQSRDGGPDSPPLSETLSQPLSSQTVSDRASDKGSEKVSDKAPDKDWDRGLSRYGLPAATLALLVACSVLSRLQLSYWSSSQALWSRALEVTPRNPIALGNLGSALVELNQFDEAAKNFEAALKLKPRYAEAQSNLGFVCSLRGNLDEAIAHYRRAIEIKPDLERAHFLLGSALKQQGNLDEAIQEYREAVRLGPNWAGAWNDLAWILATNPDANVRDGAEAVRLAEHACKLTRFQEALFVGTLAAAYAEEGRFEKAVETGELAKNIATASGQEVVTRRNEELLQLYREGRPFREEQR